MEGFDQWDAEALVLAGAQKQIRDIVVRRQFLVADVPAEVHVGRAQRRHQLVQHCQVLLESAMAADQQQARMRVESRPIGVEDADDVLDPLVRDHPAHKQEVRALVVELAGDAPSRVRRTGATKSGTTGSTPVSGNPSDSSSSRLNSESPSARSQRST